MSSSYDKKRTKFSGACLATPLSNGVRQDLYENAAVSGRTASETWLKWSGSADCSAPLYEIHKAPLAPAAISIRILRGSCGTRRAPAYFDEATADAAWRRQVPTDVRRAAYGYTSSILRIYVERPEDMRRTSCGNQVLNFQIAKCPG